MEFLQGHVWFVSFVQQILQKDQGQNVQTF